MSDIDLTEIGGHLSKIEGHSAKIELAFDDMAEFLAQISQTLSSIDWRQSVHTEE